MANVSASAMIDVELTNEQGKYPIIMKFEKVPELGDEIIIEKCSVWIISIGKQVLYLPPDTPEWSGQYTLYREKYFKPEEFTDD